MGDFAFKTYSAPFPAPTNTTMNFTINAKANLSTLTLDEKENMLFAWDSHAAYGTHQTQGSAHTSASSYRDAVFTCTYAHLDCLNAERTKRLRFSSLDEALSYLIQNGCITIKQ